MKRTSFMSAVSFALILFSSTPCFCHADDAPRLVLKGHTKPVVDIQFAADGKTVASMGADGATILWDLSAASGRRVASLSRTLGAGNHLHFTRKLPELLIGGSSGQGFLIDPANGEIIAEYGDRNRLSNDSVIYLGGRRVWVDYRFVRVIGKGENLFEVSYQSSGVVDAVSPDGSTWITNRRCFSVNDGKYRLELIDLATGRVSGELPKYANYFQGVSWVDNQHVLVLQAFGAITLWETEPRLRLIAKLETGASITIEVDSGR